MQFREVRAQVCADPAQERVQQRNVPPSEQRGRDAQDQLVVISVGVDAQMSARASDGVRSVVGFGTVAAELVLVSHCAECAGSGAG